MPKELWQQLEKYPRYLVSSTGRVVSFCSGKPKLIDARRRTVMLFNEEGSIKTRIVDLLRK
jgi:hypothetical protein